MDEITQKLYDKALRFLSFRPRSTFEIQAFLKKHQASVDQEKEILKKLKDLNFLNDEEFVNWWIDQRQTFKPKGLRVIKIELKQKGIAKDMVEKVIGGNQEKLEKLETAQAKTLAQKRATRYQNLPREEFIAKMERFLLSRGFDWDLTKTVIDELLKKE